MNFKCRQRFIIVIKDELSLWAIWIIRYLYKILFLWIKKLLQKIKTFKIVFQLCEQTAITKTSEIAFLKNVFEIPWNKHQVNFYDYYCFNVFPHCTDVFRTGYNLFVARIGVMPFLFIEGKATIHCWPSKINKKHTILYMLLLAMLRPLLTIE